MHEILAIRLVTGWRMCVDYRELNVVIGNDQFPLSFIDQMLDRLADILFIVFLMVTPGTIKSLLSLKTNTRPLSLVYGIFTCRRMSFSLCNTLVTFQRCMMSILMD